MEWIMNKKARDEVSSFVEREIGEKPISVTPLYSLSNFVCLVELSTGSIIVQKRRPISPFTRFSAQHAPSQQVLLQSGPFHVERYIPNQPVTAQTALKKEVCLLLMRPLADFNAQKNFNDNCFHVQRILREDGPALLGVLRNNLTTVTDASQSVRLNAALDDVLEILARVRPAGTTHVLSHNDFWYSNALFDTERQRHVLIDFEYCAPNPLGYDIASYLNEDFIEYGVEEHPGFRLKANHQLPEALARDMLRFYLFFTREECAEPDEGLLERVQASSGFQNICDAEVEAVFAQFPLFLTVINCYWFLWALYYHSSESTGFSYCEFALVKHQMAREFYVQLPPAG